MSNVQCYGLFWDYSLVELDNYWALGWKPTYQSWRYEPDDPEISANQQAGIYVLQNAKREIVYIGQSGRGKMKLGDRLWSHTRNQNRGRWSHFSWFGLDQPALHKDYDKNAKAEDTKTNEGDPADVLKTDVEIALNELEAILITVCEPPMNKRGGDWGEAKEYLQWSNYAHTTNGELWEELQELRKESSLNRESQR